MLKRTIRVRRRIYQIFRIPKRIPMGLLGWGSKMSSNQEYNLVTNDEFDTRIPLHPDEAFEYGITFQAKYIGTMDVPRPTSRVEIVAAMRRVRYEFKAKGVKKRKVTVDVSTEGVRVTTRKKNSRAKKRTAAKLFGGGRSKSVPVEIMHHPIYRIFYVSHDSSDLKIFSYIAREGPANVFKCNVFKSNEKSQAMRIVRTVGQAFEVCHKLSINQDGGEASTSSAPDDPAPSEIMNGTTASKEAVSEVGTASAAGSSRQPLEEGASGGADSVKARPKHLELLPPPPKTDRKRSPQAKSLSSDVVTITTTAVINLPELPECVTKVETPAAAETSVGDAETPLSSQHQLQLLHERLDQQSQQTQAAVAQLLLLRDQLAAEQAARCEAQARTHQLLVHNKELLEHIAALVSHLQDREKGSPRTTISAQKLTLLPQNPVSLSVSGLKSLMKNEANNNNSYHQQQNNQQQNNQHNHQHLKSLDAEAIFSLKSQEKVAQNQENNNFCLSRFNLSPLIPGTPTEITNTPVTFSNMTNEQIQNYLIDKFQTVSIRHQDTEKPAVTNNNNNQDFFQNAKAFPNIPPISNHVSETELSTLLNFSERNGYCADNVGFSQGAASSNLKQSQSSIFSSSTTGTSTPDGASSDDGIPFIMPLSHNGTLAATGQDGRVRLIVPVSPSGSVTDVVQLHAAPAQHDSGNTLRVPDRSFPTSQPVITRTTSEKVPNRSELMAAMRSQWTRHTTK